MALGGDALPYSLVRLMTEEETSTKVMKMSPLEMVCYVYLKNLPYIIFAEWDISNEQSHEDAARWLAEQITAIHELLGKSD